MAQVEHIEHGIEPVFDERSEVLVLGTMPSPASREAAFFYGHPRNRFWPVLAALFDEPVPEDNAERTDLLLRHHIALWDVLASCDIEGASDASIANARPNDFSRILGTAPVRRVFCTGATSARLYGKLCEPDTGIAAEKLPSTSPANAAWSLPRLVEAYRPVAEAVTPFEPAALDVPAVVGLEQAIAAILGTGFPHNAVKAPFGGWIRAMNDARNGGTVVVAADVPSGLSAQTGAAAADTVRADATVTMIVPKPGLLAPEGALLCGRVRVAPLAYIEPLLEAESLAS